MFCLNLILIAGRLHKDPGVKQQCSILFITTVKIIIEIRRKLFFRLLPVNTTGFQTAFSPCGGPAMKITRVLVLFIAGLCAGGLFGFSRMRAAREATAQTQLVNAHVAVTRTISTIESDLSARLDAFVRRLENDREFSMKLVVDQDLSDPAVSEQAVRAMALMGLSVLSLYDSDFRLLSSGHFPASAGTIQRYPAEILGPSPRCVTENIRGETVTALMARAQFSIAENTYYCCGGYVVDSSFAARLIPWAGVRIIIQTGSGTYGTGPVSTMSKIDGSRIIINDTTWAAVRVDLPVPAESSPVTVITVIAAPKPLSLSSFLLG